MKNKVKTIIAVAVVMAFAMISVLVSSGLRADNMMSVRTAGSSGSTGEGILTIQKDETVYALLNEDGSVRSVYVVNHSRVPRDGTYADYGSYKKVESLTENIQPRIEGDQILWELKESYGDFYYQGELAGGELPWVFRIQYFLDGNEVKAQDLAGKSGKVEIALSVTANEAVLPVFRERFAMQIQVPVNLKRASVISAEGATQVVAGQTNTLAYTVLPGASASYRLVLEARDFEMDSMNIGISTVDYSNVLSSGSLSGDFGEGFRELSQGMEEWIDGARSVKSGLAQLSDGMGQLAAGMHDLSAGGSELSKGAEELSQGFRQFSTSLGHVSDGSAGIRDGLSGLAANGKSVLGGYEQLAQGILAQLPGEAEKAQLRMLAQYAGSTDSSFAQAGQLAQSLLEQIAGLEQIYQNLTALNGGLSQYTGGVAKLSEEYSGFDQGVAALAQSSEQLMQGIFGLEEGGRQLSGGLSALEAGMTEMHGNVKDLPGHVQQLIDGGLEIKKGTDAAGDAIAGMLGQDGEKKEIVSFVSPGKGMVDSVQFVIRTPVISVPEKEKEASTETVTKRSFWQKFIALFS